MTTEIQLWQCGTCGRYLASEKANLDHQSLFSRLHAHDPEVDEHDGESWRVVTLAVGDSLEYGSKWMRLLNIDDDDDEPYHVETTYSRRHATFVRMSAKALAAHVTGSREAGIEGLRAFAAAQVLDVDLDAHPEVDMDHHFHLRSMHWHDHEQPERLLREVAEAQLRFAMLTFNESRKAGR